MKTVHLVVPGLLLPQEVMAEACEGVATPGLSKWLARAEVSTERAESLEDWLCNAFGIQGQAVAPLTLQADGGVAAADYWLRADPIHLSLQRASMIALPLGDLSRQEADAMLAEINRHVAGYGLQFSAPQPQRWYVRVASAPEMRTTALGKIVGQDAKYCLPQGDDAPFWHRLFNEIQMLLHAHPANQAREARGALAVNSVWFWGGGRRQALAASYALVCGEQPLLQACAQVAGVRQQAGMAAVFPEGETLCVWDGLGRALRQGDGYAWGNALQELERAWVVPLLHKLGAGEVDRLVLHMPGARQYLLSRAALWKFWRRPRALPKHALV